MAFKLDTTKNFQSLPTSRHGTLEDLLKKEIILFGKSFNNKKKQAFYNELSVLLKAGITIKEGLILIIQSIKKVHDKELIEKILHDLINGKSFSEAVFKTKSFSEYEFYSLKIGEETGTIAQVCMELGLFYERKNEQKRIVIAALTYPIIVLSTALIVVLFMLAYVVPMFQDIFKQNNIELPFITRAIIRLSNLTQTYWLYFVFFSIGFFIMLKTMKNNLKFTRFLHLSLMKIPVFGRFIIKVYLAQFTQAVALLTTAKVPILNSIQMVRKMIKFVPLQEALEEVEKSILLGISLSESLKGNSIFDARIIALVKVAEETNQTEYVFKQLNLQYSQEVLQQSKVMSTILEPMIILVVGGIVAVLLVAMYLPMFQLSSAIG